MNFKKHSKRFALFALTAALALSSALFVFGCAPSEETEDPLWASTYTLPDEQSVNARLLEIYGEKEKLYLLGDSIQRMPCPRNGKPMTFNFTYPVGDFARIVIEDAVNEINEVFGVVNPNYVFTVNYSPTEEDLKDPYSVRMNITDNFSSPTVMGTAQMSTGSLMSNFGITLKDTTLDDVRYLMLTFRHEFMHILGAGDAYKNPNADTTTVMQNYNNTVYRHFSSSDVAFIDAYYRNPENPLSDAQIKDFISAYEKDNSHTQYALMCKALKAAFDFKGKATLKNELDAKNYADTAALTALLDGDGKINADFGKSDVAFTELAYKEEFAPEATYFGGFTAGENGKYSHGRQKGTTGSSFSISYVDLGEGMLLAAPNGTANITLFVRLGDHVLTLHAGGVHLGNDYLYFVRFSELELSLLQACSVNK